MTTTPTCVACGVKRRSVAIAPANDLYDFWSYKCPKCETVVKVVKPHEARSVQRAYGEHRVYLALMIVGVTALIGLGSMLVFSF